MFILHGHGTGILRSALREHFVAFPGVRKLYPAEPGDGGDGVTVVELDTLCQNSRLCTGIGKLTLHYPWQSVRKSSSGSTSAPPRWRASSGEITEDGIDIIGVGTPALRRAEKRRGRQH